MRIAQVDLENVKSYRQESVCFAEGTNAICGPNGAGKSTLLDLIAGRLKPTHGQIDIGSTVKIGYYDQLGRDLNVNQRVREAVAGDKGDPSVEDNQLMRQFWFDGDAQFAPISTLSGGERRRLQLLLTLIEQPNVLLLDEPTEGIQPSIIKDIGRVIRMLAGRGNMAILLCEQYYDFAEELADDYLVMERGEVIAMGLGSEMQSKGIRQLVSI